MIPFPNNDSHFVKAVIGFLQYGLLFSSDPQMDLEFEYWSNQKY